MSGIPSSMLSFEGGQIFVTGGRGPQGAQGPAGASTKTYTSGMDIVVNRLVYVKNGLAYHADNSTFDTASHVVGLATQSVSSGGSLQVLAFGDRTDVSWTFTGNEQLWLGSNGQLLTMAPTSGILVQVGVVTSSTSINLTFSKL